MQSARRVIPAAWHHHGDRDVYVFHLEGGLIVENADGTTAETGAGHYKYLPAEEVGVHRYVVPDDVEETVGIVCYVGTGPVVVNVEAPASS